MSSVNSTNKSLSFEKLIHVFNCCSCTILNPHPQEYVVTPRKKSRGLELMQDDEDFNHDINNTRAAIEYCDDSLIEVCALMELRYIVFLHITNRSVYIENTRLYMPNKGQRERVNPERKG